MKNVLVSKWARYSFAWVLGSACLLCAPYLTTLTLPFDFADDGNLVYPPKPLPTLGEWLRTTGQITLQEFHTHGTFRPLTLAHWTGQANLLGPHAFRHRLLRLAWAILSVTLFLLLLRELGFRPLVAFLTAAVAMWNPWRNEIWTGLGLTEAFGMPYAMAALLCAVKANRSQRPWCWDVPGMTAMLAALACKNTFAAVIPVQMFLRLAAGGQPWGEAWRQHGRRALLLGVTMLVPIVHFIVFRLDPQPKAYTVSPPTLSRAVNFVLGVLRSASLHYLAPALILFLIFLRVEKTAKAGTPTDDPSDTGPHTPTPVIVTAAGLLLLLGVGIYLPVAGGVTGRYTIPAVWGADLLLAVMLQAVLVRPANRWRTAGLVVFGVGVAYTLAANLAHINKQYAKLTLLWQALYHVEQHAPKDGCIVVYGKTGRAAFHDLVWAEGIHFGYHLQNRSRSDLAFVHVDPQDTTPVPNACMAVTSDGTAPPGGPWRLAAAFSTLYRVRQERFHCHVWARPEVDCGSPETAAQPAASTQEDKPSPTARRSIQLEYAATEAGKAERDAN